MWCFHCAFERLSLDVRVRLPILIDMMNTQYLYALIGLIAGFGSGYYVSTLEDGKAMTHNSMQSAAHHEMIEVDAVRPIPSASLVASPDTKGGYNVRLTTTDFRFTPENAGAGAVPNEGHAHLFVNGTKIARMYGEWFYVSGDVLKTGENTIEVTLNANDHSDWGRNGEHIGASVTVTK